ncbi:Uncharacterised protein [Halioglobus japonicus]|nr:Uncharacterised protein [Halioglobus japonicus]
MTRHAIKIGNHPRLLTYTLSVLTMTVWAITAGAADSRQVFSGETHNWLRAVGKLKVPGQRYREGRRSHYVEDCSATLVSRAGRSEADTIVTAWHCLEWYDDLTKPITFTAVSISGELVQREAHRLQDGGGMHADWAILRLRIAVPGAQIVALQVHPDRADPNHPVTMAGFSKDDGLGAGGIALTFDADCTITEQKRSFGDTDCTAFKGASGGAVVQLSDDGEPLFCGVISQGNGAGRSTFVPVSGFRNALNLHVN